MLFFNFLCLFYLMVLINSHTISKNIVHDETIDDIVDRIHDLEFRREYKPKHDRLHRYYRKEEKEDAVKAIEREGQKVQSTTAKLVLGATELTKLAKTVKPITKSTKHSGFWSKFRYRGNDNKSKAHKKDNELYKRKAMPRRRSYRKKQYLQYHPADKDYRYDYTGNAFNERRIPSFQRHNNVDKRKRDVSIITTSVNAEGISTRASSTSRAASTLKQSNSKSSPLFRFTTVTSYEPLHSSESLTKALTALTTRIDDLKKEYGLKTYSLPTFTTENKIKNVSTVSPSFVATTRTTTEDVDFLGTAQIEALLNDIKIKAVQMVGAQSPAVTDIITNTVTETTFEADPILTHISTPGYALSTFISIDNDSPFSKRTACNVATGSKANDTVVIANTEPTHHISVRSINEDVFTIAQTIEDILQKELKKVLKLVKGKSSSQLADEVQKVKSTAKQQTEKMIKKITHSDKKQSATRVTKPISTPKTVPRVHTKKRKGLTLKQMRRSPKHGKNEKNKAKTSSASTQSTFDDYVMLTLYEQILTKTHEDNVMKLLTTPTLVPKNRNNFRLFKRAPGILARVSLTENKQKLYDDVILPDEIQDYGTKTNNPFSTSTESVEDTSYEGLSNKISYNDYVNGYKHYLKFQKEQGNQNFSNLIRYQAHRHHSVDDIGKFILNKIPQLPTKRLKRFFDNDIMEDQDISTKSDDSWFKKHFYLFIDNGPPRKFHTSQTVELKSPITDSSLGSTGTKAPVSTPRPKNKSLTEIDNENQDSIEESLEKLSKALDESKSRDYINVIPKQDYKLSNADVMEEEFNKVESSEYDIFKGLGSIGLVDKLFKGRKTPKHNIKVDKINTKALTEIDREKRNTNINDDETNNLYKFHSNSLRSTIPNDIETRNKNDGYVDVNLIPRPTAVVKLRENNNKKSKLKKFFYKFRFSKRNKHKETKKAKRTKREYRAQRFNPLKKLKEIFKGKQLHKIPTQIQELQDYDIMTTHIDSFKPVKYDKVISIEEMKGQIPNITEDLTELRHSESWKPDDKSMSIDMPFLSSEASPEMSDTSSVTTTPSFSELTSSRKLTSNTKLKPKPSPKHQSTTKNYPVSSTNFDMVTFDLSTYDATKSLDDLKSEIDSLQMKQSMLDDKPVLATSPKSFSTARYFNDISVKKIYVPPHIQTVQLQQKPIHAKAEPKDIKIQTKLTRIAKFPLSYFTHDHNIKIDPVIERPQIYEYANKDKSPRGKICVDLSPQKRIRKNSLNTYVTVSPRYPPSQNFNDYYKVNNFNKPYPDYFNDLLMWHGDLLNTDKVTSPIWENILETLKQDTEFSTPSMIDMQNELVLMKDYLKDKYLKTTTTRRITKHKAKLPTKVKKDKTGNNSKKSRNIIKTVALKDNTMAQSKDIVIQGEAKYFHLIKQPEADTDKYIKAADLLNDLNKIYFKSPAIKYNIEDKIHDAKRNGEFWIDNIEGNRQGKTTEEGSPSLLFLDTTLLAYDDGPDFLMDRPKQKKMSKNSLGSSKPLHNKASHRPVTKTNQSPVQYFSTPLPMRNNDFERFLKDNQIDVQSVTTPLFGMPQFVKLNKGSTKDHADKKEYQSTTDRVYTSKKIQETPASTFVTIIDPFNLDNNANRMDTENNSTDQFTTKDTLANKYKNVDDKRLKRYSEVRNERFFTFEPFRRKSKFSKVKKKIKLFDKKNTASNTFPTSFSNDIRYTIIAPLNEVDNTEKEVELTIINMNDVDHSYDSKELMSEEKLKTENPKHINQREKAATEKTVTKTKTTKHTDERSTRPFAQKIHNKMLYNNKQKDKENEKNPTPTTTSQTTCDFDNTLNLDSSIITDDISTTTFHPMINHELFGNFHAKNPPKRVRISSHSYKYDIVYDNEPAQLSKKTHRSHKKGYNKLAPAANINKDEKRSHYYIFSNAEHTGLEKEMNWITKSRRNRQVTNPLFASTKSTYSYEKLESTVPNWREKRRLNLLSNIRGKLKTLLRKKSKSTTPVSTKAKTPNREAKDTTAIKLSTIEERKVKREKQDELKEQGFSTIDNGFNVDYDIDIDRTVDRASANSGKTDKINAETKNMNQTQKDEDLMLGVASIPYLTTMINEQISTIKDNITTISYQDLKKETASITTTRVKNDPLSYITSIKQKIKGNSNSKEDVYFEPLLYDNKIYYEESSQTPKPSVSKQTLETDEDQILQTQSTETKLEKRDVQPAGKFTAKDVAALEVIVDLVKNTVNYEERDAIQEYTEGYYLNHPTILMTTPSAVPKSTLLTNSIQVHIAIPYNLQVEKKRSLDSYKVRRVFAAKMFSPVDLEYQVQAFDDNNSKSTTARTITIAEPEYIMTPKMYLLIDANGTLAKGNFPMKPLKGNVDLSKVRVRQVTTTKAFATQKAETTSGKSIGKVTLSKDFVAAINKHLVQLYENLSSLNESTPKHHVQVRDAKFSEFTKKFRRHINWDAVKKYFGHDGVCNCKCKPNQKMCRACAASDAVISELIFEFDNLARYMHDHCTEIQTYFWMNPSGGKKLRDTVHRVDQTLHDYFKRVKGKCEGRTCKTFSTCIDKRSFVKQKKMPKKYIGDPLIVDLQRLASDIETTSNLGICYTDILIGKGESMINTIGNCIKDVSKREKSVPTSTITTADLSMLTTKKPIVKNIYSLDNINVNIICKPKSKLAIASSTADMFTQTVYAPLDTTEINFMSNPNFYDYNSDDIHYKKRKGFRQFFGNKRFGNYKMKNFFTYYVAKDYVATTPMRIFRKRQTSYQIEDPLVSDTGGIFWKEYLKGQSVNPLPQELTTETDRALIVTDMHNSSENDADTSAKSRNELRKVKNSLSEVNERTMTTTANPYLKKHVFQRNVKTTDYSSIDTLSQNINELFKIFHNMTDLKEIENMSTQNFDLSEKDLTTKPKQMKTKKTTKIFKTLKEKLHFKHTSNATKTTKVPKTTSKKLPTIENTDDTDNIITYNTTLSTNTITSEILPSTLTETTSKSTEAKTTTLSLKPQALESTFNYKSSQSSKKNEDSSQYETTKQDATTVKQPAENANAKGTESLKESSLTSKKNELSSQSEPTKHETTSITDLGEDDNVKITDNLPKLTKKTTKSNFLNKLKMATFDFFHNKAKGLHKTTPIVNTNKEIRKSRSPSTENTNFAYFHDNKEEKHSLPKQGNNKNVTSEVTTDKNPTIIIINDYGTEMEPNFVTDTQGNDNFKVSEMESSTELNENSRNLFLSILNYEAKKLNNELERIKKDWHQVERNFPSHFTENEKIGFFGVSLSTDNALNSNGKDYDILRTLKELELPTPKGLDIEKKETGLLQKIANKLGVRVLPDTRNEKVVKSHVHETSSDTALHNQEKQDRNENTGDKPATENAETSRTYRFFTGDKPPNAEPSKLNPKKKLRLNPMYSAILHPIVTVNVNSNQEASKPHSGQVCDIDATLKRVQEIIQLLPKKEFETYIINKTCDKYKNLPKYFLIDVSLRKRRKKVNKFREQCSTENIIKWDWIRNKRSLNYNADNTTDTKIDNAKVITQETKESDLIDESYTVNGDFEREKSKLFPSRLTKSVKPIHEMFLSHNNHQTLDSNINNNAQKQTNFVMEGSEYFETLEKDVYGIYRSRKKRSKRATVINELETGLKNLPYSSRPNESYAMLGDSVVIQCTTNKINAGDDRNGFRWITDRKDMLLYDNVIVDGPKLVIREVEARNLGDYTCRKGNMAQKKVRLTVITLPTFKVVFTPIYSIDGECNYDDLKAVQSLGTIMSKEVCSEDRLCSVAVDEPVCLRDRVSNKAFVRLTAMMSIPPNGDVRCSGRCRRDLHNSLTLMAAANAPALASVAVIIMNDELNKTLVPSFSSDSRRSIITHTLRRKDSINHRDYYSHAFSPESVNVVASCPAGYYLISDQKICAACPLGSCPVPGVGASTPQPSVQASPLGKRFRRCYWWYPSCGWCAAGWGAACACAGAAALLHARGAGAGAGAGGGVMDVNTARTRSPRARPLSPSRVILAKFFRGSRTSTKATDSQDTKFGLWKEKNLPPPLPPIDFDI